MISKTRHTTLILLLGGTGSRFDAGTPKQFLRLLDDETPLFMQSLRAIHKHLIIDHLILAVNKEYLQSTDLLEPVEALKKANPEMKIDIVEGGRTRHESFKNAAAKIISNESHALLLHDANRPFISDSFGAAIAQQVSLLSTEKTCLIPVIPSVDSLCKVSEMGKVVNYLSRETTCRIQTPQLIYAPALKEALKKSQNFHPDSGDISNVDYTDEGSFMLGMGFDVYTFPGDPANIKITTRGDLR